MTAGYLLRSKAPLRLSFAGGGTDVPPFPELEGGLVLNATISRYAHGTLVPRRDRQIRIESIDFDLALEYALEDAVVFDGRLDLAKAAIQRMGSPDAGGFDLFLQSNAPPGSGLGSSSAMMVALIGLLRDYHRLALTDYDIARLAYTIERTELGLKGGLQDQYAATFGGFNFIEFHREQVVVNPLRIRSDIVNELEHNLLLCYTGVSRPSDGIIDDQTQRLTEHEKSTLDGLRAQKQLAVDMKDALLQGRLSTFAELLGQAWESKKKLSPKISSPLIEEAYAAALREGAISGKVTGAGGGGYLLFYCDYRRKHRVAECLSRMGIVVEDFSFAVQGLDTWRVDASRA